MNTPVEPGGRGDRRPAADARPARRTAGSTRCRRAPARRCGSSSCRRTRSTRRRWSRANVVYIAHSEENVDEATQGRVVAIDGTGSGDVTKTKELWRSNRHESGFPSPLVHDGRVYVVDNSANLYGARRRRPARSSGRSASAPSARARRRGRTASSTSPRRTATSPSCARARRAPPSSPSISSTCPRAATRRSTARRRSPTGASTSPPRKASTAWATRTPRSR